MQKQQQSKKEKEKKKIFSVYGSGGVTGLFFVELVSKAVPPTLFCSQMFADPGFEKYVKNIWYVHVREEEEEEENKEKEGKRREKENEERKRTKNREFLSLSLVCSKFAINSFGFNLLSLCCCCLL